VIQVPEAHTALEAEINVLGGALLDVEAFLSAQEVLDANDFYSERHRIIWQHLELLHKSGQPLDTDLLMTSLRDVGKLEIVGGIAYLLGLQRETMVSVYSKFYAQAVRDKSILRLLSLAGQRIIQASHENTNPTEAMNAASAALNAVKTSSKLNRASNLMDGFESQYDLNIARGNGIKTQNIIYTGISKFDNIHGGFEPGSLIVGAGRPGMGKSVKALQTAIYAGEQGQRTLLFSLEMKQHELLQRAVACRANVLYDHVRYGKLSPIHLGRVQALSDIPVMIFDQRGLSIDDIVQVANKEHRMNPLNFMVVDYLQRIKWRKNGTSENIEFGYMTQILKDLAGSLNIPILLISQLNRDVEKRADKHPNLGDLRGSGSIEQDADTVIFYYRPGYYNRDETDNTAEWDIAKCRAGHVGLVTLEWHGAYQKFTNGGS
jgi:replicative DNA helicase